jgi:hypothetical protein
MGTDDSNLYIDYDKITDTRSRSHLKFLIISQILSILEHSNLQLNFTDPSRNLR